VSRIIVSLLLAFAVRFIEQQARKYVEGVREADPSATRDEVVEALSAFLVSTLKSEFVNELITGLIKDLSGRITAEYFVPDKDTWVWG